MDFYWQEKKIKYISHCTVPFLQYLPTRINRKYEYDFQF